MARLKRYHNPGSLYHVMLRENDRQDIFFSKTDRYALCFLLQEGVERYDHTRKPELFYSQYASKIESPEELAELRNRFKDGQVLGEDKFLDEIRKTNNIQVNSKISIQNILKAVCYLLEIKEEFIVFSRKSKSASYARGIVSSIANREKIPVEELAKSMG